MKVTFLPANVSVETDGTNTIYELAIKHGIFIESPCGGNKRCKKCKVVISRGNVGEYSREELQILTKEEREKQIRLACCFKPREDTLVLVTSQAMEKEKVVAKESVESKAARLGVALDIGTTTLEYALYNLDSKQFIFSTRFENPQRRYGADVISRLHYMQEAPDKVKELQQVLITTLNQSFAQELEGLQLKSEQIERIVCVGNTTMTHVLVNASIDSLAVAPCHMTYSGGEVLDAASLGFFIHPKGTVVVLPNVEGHVGADLLSCVLATKLGEKKGNHLLLDVGTNGEMALVKEDGGKSVLYCCSTAAGPAFEGGNLSCGMTAKVGAITRVNVLSQKLIYQVVGNVKPIGISGSGIIDALALMLELGFIDETGKLEERFHGSFPLDQDGLSLSQEDIRQIQLAKGAIAAGVNMLLKKAGLTISQIDSLTLAGAFGSNINLKHGITIGLLPRISVTRIKAVGNAALKGAIQILLQEESLEHALRLANEFTHIELANEKEFQEEFLVELNFFRKR